MDKAADQMNIARELDLQDRFINSKCAKYMLRVNQVEEAEKILALFTRKDVPATQDLVDMQCQWFNIEEGYAYLRQKEYGKALKRFHVIEKIYDDIYDDQFDFHTYCMRKMTLRAYVRYAKKNTERIRIYLFASNIKKLIYPSLFYNHCVVFFDTRIIFVIIISILRLLRVLSRYIYIYIYIMQKGQNCCIYKG